MGAGMRNLATAGGAQIVRPALFRSIGNEKIKSWVQIRADIPGTPAAEKPSTLDCVSFADGDFDGGGFKGVYKFSGARDLSKKNIFLGSVSLSGLQGQYVFSAPPAASGTYIMQCRVRFITSDFNIATITWNNVVVAPSITFSASVLVNDVLKVSCKPDVAGVNMSIIVSPTFDALPLAFFNLFPAAPLVAYGVVVDARMVGSNAAVSSAIGWIPLSNLDKSWGLPRLLAN